MSSVTLERLNKVFPRPGGQPVQALRDFSLQVAEQEVLTLLGPSGSGKTTALRLIAGLDEPTSGSISIGGTSMHGVPPRDRNVAMVFQHHALYPHMSIRNNLAFGLRLRKCPRAEIKVRVREMAELLELAPLLDLFPSQLSGGQRQRVAFGRALIRQPRVLLCDEPLSQLDAPLRARMRADLLRLRERLAISMIYVTHDQVEALTLGDRVAVIHEGALQQVDPPMRLFREPKNLFVAGFIGLPPMNLLHGTLTPRHQSLWFQEDARAGTFSLSLPVDPTQAVQLQAYAGKTIVVGVRPEQFRTGSHAAPPADSVEIETVIQHVERAGPDAWLHCATGAHRIVVRAEADAASKTGDRLRLFVDFTNARYFDPVTQQALC